MTKTVTNNIREKCIAQPLTWIKGRAYKYKLVKNERGWFFVKVDLYDTCRVTAWKARDINL